MLSKRVALTTPCASSHLFVTMLALPREKNVNFRVFIMVFGKIVKFVDVAGFHPYLIALWKQFVHLSVD